MAYFEQDLCALVLRSSVPISSSQSRTQRCYLEQVSVVPPCPLAPTRQAASHVRTLRTTLQEPVDRKYVFAVAAYGEITHSV